MPLASIRRRIWCAGQWHGSCRSKTRMVAGARMAKATVSTMPAINRRQARRCLSAADARQGWLLERSPLYRHWIPTRLLPALPRLSEGLSAVGAGALSQPAGCQCHVRCGGNVNTARREPGFVIAATGLMVEAWIAASSASVKTVVSGGHAAELAGLL